MMIRLALFCIFFFYFTGNVFSQLSLSIQGSIQNSSGDALPDGKYELIFNIYSVATGGQAVWTETQPQVEIIGGLYSSILGLIKPLNAASPSFDFTKTYYLGVTLKGKPEISPRAELGASAYSMSVSGKSNTLPSQGSVGIGTLSPNSVSQLHVLKTNGPARILVEGRDTARIKFKADLDSATISYYNGKVFISKYDIIFDEGINLADGKTVAYNSDTDWRLIEVDDFATNEEGWYSAQSWNNNTEKSRSRTKLDKPFSRGYMILQNTGADDTNSPVLKKAIDLTGKPHSRVKVVFTYHFFDSWDYNNGKFEFAFAGFLSQLPANSTNGFFQLGWRAPGSYSTFGTHFNSSGYNSTGISDFNLTASMIAETKLDKFWVVFGSNLNQGIADENFGISNIEIWVK